MGTKIHPGQFDCYRKLDPDEPFFVLRAKDPIAPYCVEAWRCIRAGDLDGAQESMDQAHNAWQWEVDAGRRTPLPRTSEKSSEARQCAVDMLKWFRSKL